MIQCPHYGSPAITLWRKQILGPGRAVLCDRCAKQITVDQKRAWLVISLLLVIGLAGKLFFNSYVGWVVGVVVVAPLCHFYVPLVAAKP